MWRQRTIAGGHRQKNSNRLAYEGQPFGARFQREENLMRPQQQNRRMRGRNNNNNSSNNNNNNNSSNRKGPNPLTRNYESNGPDVKIRGSAQQIAEKYATLARDAHSSGDRVMAENYLQHAEHYNRIIAAAMAQMPIQQQQQSRDDFDADMDDERDDDGNGNIAAESSQQGHHAPQSHAQQSHAQPQPVVNGTGPQPDIEGMPAEVALNPEAAGEGQPREGRRERRPRPEGRRPERRQPDQVVAQQAEAPQAEVHSAAPEAVQAVAVPAEASPAEVAEGEVVAPPRRGRRPRRVAAPEAEADAPASDAGLVVAES